jgi:tetratricopeptide (TPR) repeat protein
MLCLFTAVKPCYSREGFFDVSDFTHLADIVDIINYSGRYDYHDTYFDPARASDRYYKNLRQADINQYIVIENDQKKVKTYEPSDEVNSLIRQSEEALQVNDRNRALKLLQSALETDPDYFMLPVYLGRIHFEEKNHEEALRQANKGIESNPVNFEAYRLKGEIYLAKNDYENAQKNLVTALIFNRNDWKTLSLLNTLGSMSGFDVFLSPFLPLYSLEKMDNGKIRLYIDTDEMTRWMPYAFCKAVWKYEPGYFEKKTGRTEYQPTFFEEMESINCMLWGYETFRNLERVKPDPMLERMMKIQSRFFLREFVLFEIISPTEPEILCKLDEAHLNDLLEYINEFIIVKKPGSYPVLEE